MNNLLLCLFALGMLCEACCLLDRLNDRPGMPLPRVRAPSQGQPSLGDRLRGGSMVGTEKKLIIRSSDAERQGLSIAAVHFGSMLAISYYFASRSADWRLKFVFKGLAYNCLVLAFGHALGNRLHVLGYPLFSLLSLPRFFISPLISSMLASSVVSIAEARGVRMYAASWVLQPLSLLIGSLSAYSIFWHMAFGASAILDSTWSSAGLVYYKLHPYPPSTAILLPPILLVSLALSFGVKMLRRGSFALLAGSCSMISGILGSQNFVIWSEAPACLLLALSIHHCAEVSTPETGASTSLASKVRGFLTVFAAMLLPHLAWHVATLNGHGGPEEEEEDTNLDGRREGMRIQIAANNLIVNNSPKSADQASYSCFPTSSMDQDVAAVSTLPRQLETSNKKSSQSTFQRISLNSAARIKSTQTRTRLSETPRRNRSSQDLAPDTWPSPAVAEENPRT